MELPKSMNAMPPWNPPSALFSMVKTRRGFRLTDAPYAFGIVSVPCHAPAMDWA
jgi:hypothetical protein